MNFHLILYAKINDSYISKEVHQLILEEVKSFAPPQDLRHFVFLIGAIQQRKKALEKDISVIRMKCLVRLMDEDNLTITMSNGVLAYVKLHYCYSNVSDVSFSLGILLFLFKIIYS